MSRRQFLAIACFLFAALPPPHDFHVAIFGLIGVIAAAVEIYDK